MDIKKLIIPAAFLLLMGQGCPRQATPSVEVETETRGEAEVEVVIPPLPPVVVPPSVAPTNVPTSVPTAPAANVNVNANANANVNTNVNKPTNTNTGIKINANINANVNTNANAPAPAPAPTPAPTPAPQPAVRNFTIAADDKAFSPSSVTVNKGDTVKITFKVSADEVYFGGLRITSSQFNTGNIAPGGSATVTFTADSTFTFSSYWPSSGVKKADGTVVVK